MYWFKEEANDKDPKFKVGNHVRISKYKIIFAKRYTANWSEEFLLLVKLRMQFHGHILLMILMVKKALGNFMKKSYRRLIKKKLGLKRWLKEKVRNYMLSGRVMIIRLIVGLIKKI